MIKNLIKNLNSKKRMLWLICLVFLLSLISLAINGKKFFRKTAVMLSGKQLLQQEIAQKNQQLQNLINKEHELQRPITKLAGMRKNFWMQEERKLQYELRKKLEDCAKSSEVRLKTIGTLQKTKITEVLFTYELNITADMQLDKLVAFLQKLEKEKPSIFLKNISISPDNTRSPNYLIFNATLQVVVISDPKVSQQFWRTTE